MDLLGNEAECLSEHYSWVTKHCCIHFCYVNRMSLIYGANASTGKFLLLTLSEKSIPPMRSIAAAQFVLPMLTRHFLRKNNSTLVTRVFQHRCGRGRVQYNGESLYFKNLITRHFCACEFQIFLTLRLRVYFLSTSRLHSLRYQHSQFCRIRGPQQRVCIWSTIRHMLFITELQIVILKPFQHDLKLGAINPVYNFKIVMILWDHICVENIIQKECYLRCSRQKWTPYWNMPLIYLPVTVF
jgi:hypothetical protein